MPRLTALPERELVHLASLAELIDVSTGAVLTREGERAHEAYLVVEGQLRAVRGGLPVATLAVGDLAGEVSLLDRQPRATGLEAVTAARVAVLGRHAMQRLVHTSPRFTHLLLGQLAARVRCGVPT